MLKTFFILLIPLALFIDCGVYRPKSDNRVAENTQQIAQNSLPEKKNCNFSNYKPMKARANYGSPMISMPRPEYPDDIKARGIEGRVSVLLLVNVRSGIVEQACIIEGNDALEGVVKEAALKIKFAPYKTYIQERYDYAEEIVGYNFVAK